MQGTWVRFLDKKNPHATGQLSLYATTPEPECPRACAPEQEKPLQWEAQALQLQSNPHSRQLEKAWA